VPDVAGANVVTDLLASLTSAFTLAFVVTSMFGLGLGLTVGSSSVRSGTCGWYSRRWWRTS
jgi:hypothetical protein